MREGVVSMCVVFDSVAVRGGLPDVSLIVEDLLVRVGELRSSGGDPVVVAELLAQVDVLLGW